MYVLIQKVRMRSAGSDRYYETLPDGRAIVPISEVKTMGVVTDIDIVPTARELKELIEEQKASGLYTPINPQDTAPDVNQGTTDTNIHTDTHTDVHTDMGNQESGQQLNQQGQVDENIVDKQPTAQEGATQDPIVSQESAQSTTSAETMKGGKV